jgi:hypothetical protein
MPWWRLASAASDECMKSMRARTASGLGRGGAEAGREDADDLAAGRHRAEHVDAGQVHHFADLLEAELDLAVGDQLADRHAGRRLHDARPQGVEDTPALEQLEQRRAARAGGMAERARGQHGAPQGFFGRDIRPRCAGAHGDRHARAHQADLAVRRRRGPWRRACRGRRRRMHRQVVGLARLHALRGIHAADRLEGDVDPAARPDSAGQLGQHQARRHRGNALERSTHARILANAGRRSKPPPVLLAIAFCYGWLHSR